MIKMTYPNRLVKVPNIGALVEEIGRIRGQEEPGRLELPRKQQNAERQRLAGAVELPTVEIVDEQLKLYWEGGDGRNYSATLVGLDTQKGYVVVMGATSERREDPYKVWRAQNGPWF